MALDLWRRRQIEKSVEAARALCNVDSSRCSLPDATKIEVRNYVETWIIHPMELSLLSTKPYWLDNRY